MRVLMTTDAVGGVWSYSIELCKALAASGTEVILACMGGTLDADARKEASALPNVVLHESSLRLEWMEDPWDDVQRAAEWIASLLRSTRADLLHLNCYGPAIRNFDVPVLLVAHSCVHTWWRATRGGDPDASWQRYRQCVIRALCTADCVIAPTAAQLNAMGDAYEEVNLNGRAHVIHNGIDSARWSAAHVPGGRFVFGVGRVWDEAKNLGQLAAVAANPACPVVIAGDGDLNRECGGSGVVLLGSLPREQLVAYFRRAAVFAHPARYEPFGLAVLEAALSGCPLVLGDIASLRELWEGAALFVDPEDTRTWRDRLGRLLADPDERNDLGRAARARALRYGAKAMASAYVAQYRNLVAQPAENVA